MFASKEILTAADMQAAQGLLEQSGLFLPEAPDYGVAFFAGTEIAATGFRQADVIMGVCVDPAYRGGELASKLMTHLLTQANGAGLEHLLLFTKHNQISSFERLGFKVVADAPGYAALLEFGWPDFGSWLETLKISLPKTNPNAIRGAIVMNANPFTLGHRYLVEQAAAACDTLYVFVVEEDASEFPFEVRLQLVREGTRNISNCFVLPGGPYMVTRRTFPSYFTGHTRHAATYASLDATVFALRIAPELGVTRRFVGTEPYSAVTQVYNDALTEILDNNSIKLTILDRTELYGAPVSASRVRGLLAQGHLEMACRLVPDSTCAWLRSPEAASVILPLARKEGPAADQTVRS